MSYELTEEECMVVSPVWKQLVFEIPFKVTVSERDQQISISEVKELVPKWARDVRWEHERAEAVGTYKLFFQAPAESLDWIESAFVLLATMACPKAETMTWDVVTTLGVVQDQVPSS